MIAATVSRVQAIARDTLLLELQASDGRALPTAAPGSHIDLHLPSGLVRQYSLTNATGAAVGDFDNDGTNDLFVVCDGGNHLLRGKGDGTFADAGVRL